MSLRGGGWVLLAALASLCSVTVWAQLEWTTQFFQGETRPLQKTIEIAFAFRNAGEHPVAIRRIYTNCDCLEARTDRNVYAPGQTGLVTARFTVGERFGRYERSVSVETDDGSGPHRLHVSLEVPDPAAFSPRSLEWKLGSAPHELATDLVVADGVVLDFRAVLPSNENFQARLETIEAGRRYRVLVTPTSTATAANGALRVKGYSPAGEEVVVSAYANVR